MSPWLHLVEHCEGFPARVPASLHLWLALALEFDLGYILYAAVHHILPVFKVLLYLLVLDAPAPFEDLTAGDQQKTTPLAPPAIGNGPHKSVGLKDYWELPSSLGLLGSFGGFVLERA